MGTVRFVIQYAAVCAALASITGCSSAADPAEIADLAATYTASTNPLGVPLSKEHAECRARLLLEADLSDSALAAVREGKQPEISSEHDIEVMKELADKLSSECLDAG